MKRQRRCLGRRPGGVCRGRPRAGNTNGGGFAGIFGGAVAGLHGAGAVRLRRLVADDRQREVGSQGPAGADADNLLPGSKGVEAADISAPVSRNGGTDVEEKIALMVAALLGQADRRPTITFSCWAGIRCSGVQLVVRIRDAFGVKLTLAGIVRRADGCGVVRRGDATGGDVTEVGRYGAWGGCDRPREDLVPSPLYPREREQDIVARRRFLWGPRRPWEFVVDAAWLRRLFGLKKRRGRRFHDEFLMWVQPLLNRVTKFCCHNRKISMHAPTMPTSDKAAEVPLSLYHLLDPEVLANPYPLYQPPANRGSGSLGSVPARLDRHAI